MSHVLVANAYANALWISFETGFCMFSGSSFLFFFLACHFLPLAHWLVIFFSFSLIGLYVCEWQRVRARKTISTKMKEKSSIQIVLFQFFLLQTVFRSLFSLVHPLWIKYCAEQMLMNISSPVLSVHARDARVSCEEMIRTDMMCSCQVLLRHFTFLSIQLNCNWFLS